MILKTAAGKRAERCMRREMRKLTDVPFSIIANDCWGGEVYRLSGRPYTTPFVGLFVEGPCFLNIIDNLGEALSSPITELTSSRYPHRQDVSYPLGHLTAVDAELHFLHYPDFTDATEKWRRRAARLNRDALFLKAVEFDRAEVDAAYAASNVVPHPRKIVSAAHPVAGINTAQGRGLPDAVEDFHSAAVRFDVVDWLTGGDGQVSTRHLPARWLRYAGW